MLAQAPSLQLQKYNFGLLARQAPSGRRRLRYMALAHLNEGKHRRGSACLARYAPRVTRWMKWFAEEGADRLAGIPHYWSTQTLAPARKKPSHQALQQLQHSRGGGRVRGDRCSRTAKPVCKIDGFIPPTSFRPQSMRVSSVLA
jgi:hypothetical protein